MEGDKLTTYHPTSCTECEALKLGDCATCDARWVRAAQNFLAWVITIEMMLAVSCAVFYAIWAGSATESFMKFGDPYYAAKLGATAVFVGIGVLVLFNERITTFLFRWAEFYQQRRLEAAEDDDEEGDDKE
jgi:hypothetical protein